MSDNNPLDVATKITSLFQIITQAAQTYLKNVECFIYNQYPDKLMVLVDFIINVTKICFDKRVFDKKDLVIQDMLRKCLAIRQFLDTHHNSIAKFAPLPAKPKKAAFVNLFSISWLFKLTIYIPFFISRANHILKILTKPIYQCMEHRSRNKSNKICLMFQKVLTMVLH